MRAQGSEEWDLVTAPGSGITSHTIRISSFLRDQGTDCTLFVGPGTSICHAFEIKDQKFGHSNGISDEKTYSTRYDLMKEYPSSSFEQQ